MGRKKTTEYAAECEARGIDFSKFLKQIDYIEATERYDNDSEAAGEVSEAPEGAGEDRPGEAAER